MAPTGERARGAIVFFNRPMAPTAVDAFSAYGAAAPQRTQGAVPSGQAAAEVERTIAPVQLTGEAEPRWERRRRVREQEEPEVEPAAASRVLREKEEASTTAAKTTSVAAAAAPAPPNNSAVIQSERVGQDLEAVPKRGQRGLDEGNPFR